MKENEDYAMVPAKVDSDQTWDIRILKGDFIETVFRYGAVRIDGENEQITFDFEVISSPDKEVDETNEELQQIAGEILKDVIDNSIEDGSIEMSDVG